MKKLNEYKTYKEYLLHQITKTTDSNRRKKWLGEEWLIKLNGFKNIFEQHEAILKDKKNFLCIGARTGQEVVALKDLGYEAEGIDLIPCPPHVKQGDMHKLDYEDEAFDCVFSNVFDHSLYPEKKCSEMLRVLRQEGIIIMHFQINVSQDIYTEVIIEDISEVHKLFNGHEILKSEKISTNFAAMNYEIIIRKKIC